MSATSNSTSPTQDGLPDVPLAPETLAVIIKHGGIERKALAEAVGAEEADGQLRVALGALIMNRFVKMDRVANATVYAATDRGRAADPQASAS